jgi:FkbM family methyltransferase
MFFDLVKKVLPKGTKVFLRNLVEGKAIEEVDLVHRVLAQDRPGVMIDVGAHVGTSLTPFAQSGWRVFAFEPDPKNREKLKVAIAGFESVSLDERAVSDQDGAKVAFYSSDVSTGISGLSDFHPTHEKVADVETITLKTFCGENAVGDIDFLKIDTEGFDLFVLKGFDWDGQRHPEVILTEFEDNKTRPLGYSFLDQADFLAGQGYELLVSEWFPIVEYGRRHKWRRFVTNPQKVSDRDAWGNIIAFKKERATELLRMAARTGKIES